MSELRENPTLEEENQLSLIRSQPETIRSEAQLLLKQVGLTVNQLKGMILDLGSGERCLEKFALQNALPNVKVVSLDIDSNRYAGDLLYTKRQVQADGNQLPFGENTFDLIIASHSGVLEGDPEDPKTISAYLQTLATLNLGKEIRVSGRVLNPEFVKTISKSINEAGVSVKCSLHQWQNQRQEGAYLVVKKARLDL